MDREQYAREVEWFMWKFMMALRDATITKTKEWNAEHAARCAIRVWWLTHPPAGVDPEDAYRHSSEHPMNDIVVEEAQLAAEEMEEVIAGETWWTR